MVTWQSQLHYKAQVCLKHYASHFGNSDCQGENGNMWFVSLTLCSK